MHQAFRGIFDYDALKQRSNGVYDQEDAALRGAPDAGSFNNTMSLMNNQASKLSPWAPFFQALDDQGVSKVGQDVARPHGLADNPSWGLQGANPDLGDQIPAQPLMASNNLASPALAALRRHKV